MKVVIACGGSGGHIFPGLALAQEILREGSDNDVFIISSRKPLDCEILQKSGCKFAAIPHNPLLFGRNPLRALLFFAKFVIGVILSIRLLLKYRPHSVVGFGGSLSAPVIFAAWLLRIPRLIHEQNLVAGLANRIESVFADRVAVSFKETERFFNKEKVVMVGNPVRGNFLDLDRSLSRERLGLDKDTFTLFVIGGSQGATFLNRVVADAIGMMDKTQKESLQVIHIAGKDNYATLKQSYIKDRVASLVFPFLDRIDTAYTAADLVIARSGATTIAELTYFGKPSILIPYPEERVHQRDNAYFLSANNASITLEERDSDPARMKDMILNLAGDAHRLNEISANSRRLGNRNAGRLLAREVRSLSRRSGAKE